MSPQVKDAAIDNRAGSRQRRIPGASLSGADNIDGARRLEILETAASLIASTGLRTSMREIGEAAGLLKGSLYHHFTSKDAILVELTRRYYADLDRVGEMGLERLDASSSESVADKIEQLGLAMAECAVTHRAALQMTFHESPSSHPELVELLSNPPTLAQQAMLQTLRAGRHSGDIRADIDLPTLADRMSQTMLSVGLDVIRHNAPSERVAGVLCRVMLNGLARRSPKDAALDKSKALAAADRAIQTWADIPDDAETEADRIRAVARAEFGRRGYEITTIRDIAGVAQVGPATVIRLIGKKSEALAAIMRSFGIRLTAGYSGVLNSDATPLEKMDALSWVHINALKYFPDEWKIQQAWMRQSPPDTPNPGFAFAGRMRRLKALLSEGMDSGAIRKDSVSMDMLSRCVMNLLWMPENIVRSSGPRAAHILSRDTWLRGVGQR